MKDKMLLLMNTYVPNIIRPSSIRTLEFKAERVYCRAMQGDEWLMSLKILNSPKAFRKAHLWER